MTGAMFQTALATLLRCGIGLTLLGLAWHLVSTGQDPLDVPRLLLAATAFLAGIASVWDLVFRLATRPFLLFIDLVFSPGGHFRKPVLNLKLPAHYLKEGRHEEALAEYRKILTHHPREPEAYEKAIWLEASVFGRNAEASKLLRRAKRRGLTLDERIVRLVESPPGQ